MKTRTPDDVQKILAKLRAVDGDLAVLTFKERERLLDLIAVRQEHDEKIA